MDNTILKSTVKTDIIKILATVDFIYLHGCSEHPPNSQMSYHVGVVAIINLIFFYVTNYSLPFLPKIIKLFCILKSHTGQQVVPGLYKNILTMVYALYLSIKYTTILLILKSQEAFSCILINWIQSQGQQAGCQTCYHCQEHWGNVSLLTDNDTWFIH